MLHCGQAVLASKLVGNFKDLSWVITGIPKSSLLGVGLTPRRCLNSPTYAPKKDKFGTSKHAVSTYVSERKRSLTSSCKLPTYSIVRKTWIQGSFPSSLGVFIYLIYNWILHDRGESKELMICYLNTETFSYHKDIQSIEKIPEGFES